jgi:hypothetical protein
MTEKAKPGRTEKLPIRHVYGGILRGYLRDWKVLLVAGVIIFLPVGLIEAAVPPDLDADEFDGSVILFLAGAIPLEIVLHVLGVVIFTGVVAAGERQARSHQPESLMEMVRDLPLLKLAIADIALIGVLLAGFIALVIPALIFTIWFALIAPVIEIERVGVRAAFGRSRALIRSQFWRAAAVIIPVTLLQAAAEQFGHDLGIALLGHGFAGDAAAAVAANVLGGSLIALAAVVLYFELVARYRDQPVATAA